MNNRKLANEVIEEVLSGSEFQSRRKADLSWLEGIKDIINDVMEKVKEFLTKLFIEIFSRIGFKDFGKKISQLGSFAEGVLYFTAFVIILLLTFLLVRLILKIIKNGRFKFRKKELTDELEELTKTPDEPLRLALAYKARKDYRLSFRYFFLALLINYNEKDYIRIQKSKTNRQYLKELYTYDNELAGKTEPFFNTFYLVWYGKRNMEEEALLEWENKYYELTGKNREEGAVDEG